MDWPNSSSTTHIAYSLFNNLLTVAGFHLQSLKNYEACIIPVWWVIQQDESFMDAKPNIDLTTYIHIAALCFRVCFYEYLFLRWCEWGCKPECDFKLHPIEKLWLGSSSDLTGIESRIIYCRSHFRCYNLLVFLKVSALNKAVYGITILLSSGTKEFY